MSGITSRVPMDAYVQVPAVSITRLKELKRSPLHYRYLLENPRQSDPLRLGVATHCAVLEPERFDRDFAVWSRRTSTGSLAPRNGQYWDAFRADHVGKHIITEDEYVRAMAMRDAVRGFGPAMNYLENGDPEVTLEWELEGHACKGRVDWLTHFDGHPVLVGLKTARDCRHFSFGSVAARLGYPLQWAFYFDGYQQITNGRAPRVVEIVVESAPPHAVAVYTITNDILAYGREEYLALLGVLDECERRGEWPGPLQHEEALSLPSWVYGNSDDLGGLDLDE